MDLVRVEKLLEKYGIQSLDELEYYLNIGNAKDECIDDPVEGKSCINAQCYEDVMVPDCRKIIEIYNRYFKDDIKSKKLFIKYLAEHTEKSISSIENYLSCKSCNQQMSKSITGSLKIPDIEFKKDFCFNLEKKFNYQTLFCTEYISIKQFLLKDHELTKENFQAPFAQHQEELTTKEKEKIFDLILVPKKELKQNLKILNNIQGSNNYKINLALAAFNRNLIVESNNIVDMLLQDKAFQNNQNLLQLKAKILSSQQQDKKAISLLHRLIEMQKPSIDAETYNLLAASIKREAFQEFELYGDEEKLIKNLTRAQNIYFSVYRLNNDYYPALNYMYVQTMLQYINGASIVKIKEMQNEFKNIWSSLDHKINDWWSYIADIEYIILQSKYNVALSRLKEFFHTVDNSELHDFNLISTIRQLELFSNFCPDQKLNDIIALLKSKKK